MRARWLVAVLVLLALAGTASASHDELTLPLTEGDGTIDDGLAWLEDERVTDEGCAHDRYDEECYVERTKWLVATLGHVGVDPASWPTAEGASLDWLLDRADDLRDEALVDCQEDATTDSECADKRVFSLVKAIMAFEAGEVDPRAVPLPDGGERDLVAELLDEHGGTEFGRVDQVNDDIWALIALNDVGYEGPEVGDALDRIEQAQNADGGLGYTYDTSSSVDMTAAAIMAAAPHDRASFLEDARAYLADEQLAEGDKRGCWSISTSTSSEANAESTSWALQAVAALGEDPLEWRQDGQAPPACLRTFQADEGGFRHAEGSKIKFMSTQQALAALPWRPYGDLEGPLEPLQVSDQATVGEQHTATVPGASLRIGAEGVDSHDWTPDETGQRLFHGYTHDPVRPVELTVDVRSGDQGDTSGGEETDEQPDDEATNATPPEVHLEAPGQAERNVTFTVEAEAEPGEHPVTAFRLEVHEGGPRDWQPTGRFEVTPTRLGEVPLKAWARDAEGHVSPAAEATVHVHDASPRVAIEGPEVVNRTEPAAFEARAEDPDGSLANLTWAGPGDQTAEGANATFAFPDPGPTEVRLRATDEAGNAADATWTVHARNRAPSNLTVEPGQLEVNASEIVRAEARDPDGDPLEVAWTFPADDEPRSWGRQLHLETGPPGERVLLVNVSDPYGGWTSARVELPVREQPDGDEAGELSNVTTQAEEPEARAPSPDSGPPARVELPATIEATAGHGRLLHLDASSPSGPVVNVTVALGGPVPVRGTEDATALLPALPAGEYELAARAADRAGWGPWTNATLVVHPSDEDPELDAAGGAAENATPLGALAALAGLALAARRARP